MLNVFGVHSTTVVLPPQESNYYYPHSSNQQPKNQGTIYINNLPSNQQPQQIFQPSPAIQPQVIIKEENAPFYKNFWFYLSILFMLNSIGHEIILSDPDMKAAFEKYKNKNKPQ